MATGDVFKVSVLLGLDAVQCRPGFYLVEGSGGGDPDPVVSCGLAVVSALGLFIQTGMVANSLYSGVHVEDIQPGVAASRDFPAGPIAGDIADDNPPPPQDSMLLQLRTALRRSVGNFAAQGRIYWPGIYSTGQISGFLTPTLALSLENVAASLRAPFVTDGGAYQMHVVSFNPGTSPRTIRAIQPVTEVLPSNQVAIQRRRRPGRGM